MDMKKLLLALAALGLLVAPAQTWLMLGGDMREYLLHDTLRGQVPYVVSKLAALYAIELVWLQALLGMLRERLFGAGMLDAGTWLRAHKVLGCAALAAVVAHVLLFVVAASMRNGSPAVDLLLPWGHGIYRTWVAVGAVAFWLLVVAAGVQIWRLSRPRTRLWLHRASLLAMLLGAVHSLAIGSESRSGPMQWSYAVMGATLLAAWTAQILSWRRPQRV